jgi:hypothetical protein
MRQFSLLVVALLAGAALQTPARGVPGGNPLPALLKQAGGPTLCFRRDYDAAHRQSHKGQRTISALASLEADQSGETAWLRVRLVQHGRTRPADISAACEWGDTGGLIPAYRKKQGFACIAVFSTSSAEEAGTVLFDLAPDGNAVSLYFDEEIGLWGRPAPSPMLKLSPADRVFRLTRTKAAACRALEVIGAQ